MAETFFIFTTKTTTTTTTTTPQRYVTNGLMKTTSDACYWLMQLSVLVRGHRAAASVDL